MRILILSSGLKPEHFGGLPSHVEDLLRTLSARNVEVGYLNVGAKSPWPVTRLWKRDNLPCPAWNLTSSRSYAQYWNGTREPATQVESDHAFSKAFFSVIDAFKPDLVHAHELTSFPVELFAELKERNIRTVFSAADFYVLCPTVKLFRPDGSYCDRAPEDLDCENCSKAARMNRFLQLEHANEKWLGGQTKLRNLGRRVIRRWEQTVRPTPAAADFIQRRHQFDRFLGAVDVVLATSQQQKRILETRSSDWNVQFLQRSRKTILPGPVAARQKLREDGKITFLALNIVNPAKGLGLLQSAFAELHRDFPEAELHLYGLKGDSTSPGIRYFGPYDDSQLDAIIGSADFGLLPSIWPEAFGYVGPEMLSRGLPVIASNIGAMPDYVIDKQNGLLFDPQKSDDLVAKLKSLVTDDTLRKRLWEGAASGERHYLTMDEHVDRLTQIYSSTL